MARRRSVGTGLPGVLCCCPYHPVFPSLGACFFPPPTSNQTGCASPPRATGSRRRRGSPGAPARGLGPVSPESSRPQRGRGRREVCVWGGHRRERRSQQLWRSTICARLQPGSRRRALETAPAPRPGSQALGTAGTPGATRHFNSAHTHSGPEAPGTPRAERPRARRGRDKRSPCRSPRPPRRDAPLTLSTFPEPRLACVAPTLAQPG